MSGDIHTHNYSGILYIISFTCRQRNRTTDLEIPCQYIGDDKNIDGMLICYRTIEKENVLFTIGTV